MADDTSRDAPSIADLPPHDQLLHGIGRVAQAQVEVELVLRRLHTQLTGRGPASFLGAKRNSIDQLAQECRVMLKNSDLPVDVEQAGDDALRASIEADKLRHQVVHEWWVHEIDSDLVPEWWVQEMDSDEPTRAPFNRMRADKNSLGYRSEPADLNFVNNAEEVLRKAFMRVHSLWSVVSYARVGLDREFLDHLLPEVRGELTLMPDGRWRRANDPPDQA
jgi:hypothetical protein